MNDKCASGTGATIDKCMIKVGAPAGARDDLRFDDSKLHHVAAKCGVFAETDIVNLMKSGIPSTEVLSSLADAIVMQNLSVLTRGNTLKRSVLLLGGPNTYLPFLQDCWRLRIPETWDGARLRLAEGQCRSRRSIFVPENAAVLRRVRRRASTVSRGAAKSAGSRALDRSAASTSRTGRKARLGETRGPAALEDRRRARRVPRALQDPEVRRREARAGPGGARRHRARRWLDVVQGGASSTTDGEILCEGATSSRKGNPIQDTKELLAQLKSYVREQGADARGARLRRAPATPPTCSKSA